MTKTNAKRQSVQAENQCSSAAPSVAVQSLVKMLSSRSCEVRRAAAEAIGQIASSARAEIAPIESDILRMLTDPSSSAESLAGAAMVASALGMSAAAPSLVDIALRHDFGSQAISNVWCVIYREGSMAITTS